jgi:biopolymer transport protein ExbB
MSVLQTGFQANATTQAAKAVDTGSLLTDLLQSGGWVLVPMVLLVILMVYIFFERNYVINRAKISDENYMNRVKEFLHDRKMEAVVKLSQSTNTPVSRMIEAGISRIGRPIAEVHAALESVGRLEKFRLERGLTAFSCAAIAVPLFGLMGSVQGIMNALYGFTGTGDAHELRVLANGIYSAFTYLAVGLAIGLPALFLYKMLVSKIRKIVFVLESRSSEFMTLLNEPAKK